MPFSVDVNDFTLLQALSAEFEENKPSAPVQDTMQTEKKGKFDLQKFISDHNKPS